MNDLRQKRFDARLAAHDQTMGVLTEEQRKQLKQLGPWCLHMIGWSKQGACFTLPLDADDRLEARNFAGKLRLIGGVDDGGHVLVGARSLFRDAALRRAADQDAAPGQLVDDLATAPALDRGVAAHAPAGSMTRRTERFAHAPACACENIGRGTHAAADKHGLAGRAQGDWQIGMAR